jgi:SAM-dependent methyltransferase
VITDVIARYAPNSILDIGCGLGVRSGIYFDAQQEAVGGAYFGVDSSATAIAKARTANPDIDFTVMEFQEIRLLLASTRFEMIIMSEVSWYVLKDLSAFAQSMYESQSGTYFVHSLVVYPDGVQKFGREYFVDAPSIRAWWSGIDWLEWVEAGDTTHQTMNTVNIGVVKT